MEKVKFADEIETDKDNGEKSNSDASNVSCEKSIDSLSVDPSISEDKTYSLMNDYSPNEHVKAPVDKMELWKENYQNMMNTNYHYQIGTIAHFMRMRTTSIRKFREEAIGDKELYVSRSKKYGNLPKSVIYEITREPIKHESGQEYLEKMKKLNLCEFILLQKSEEIKRLNQLKLEREEKMSKQEENLENKATEFIDTIKKSDTACSDAIKAANECSEQSLKLNEEIKILTAQKISLQNSVSKQETILKKLRIFRNLLDSLAPSNHWKQKEMSKKLKDIDPNKSIFTDQDDEDNFQIHFEDPAEVTLRLQEYKNKCLSFIQYNLDSREILEETKISFFTYQEKLSREIETLKKEIHLLQKSEEEQTQKSEKFQQLINKYAFEKEDDESKLLQTKIAEVYRCCSEEFSEGNVNSQIMLTSIEAYLEQLIHNLTLLPAKRLNKIYRMKQKQRRRLEREKENEEKRKQQEERINKALERAELAKERKFIRKPMYRSEPLTLVRKTKAKVKAETARRQEEEEYKYFFT
ncbi:coiled-coil domain-containing protein 38-like [Centruroides sculpturatus]|uniref:coiled-coil domain-containing protein 38-like n=1 Tax=Centruroides sculpturatus TaxID=218467 RepID=UPI000C6CAC2F|nr:coiled-coil domain-containing protein 38-like [Centruroides sculpturatus]